MSMSEKIEMHVLVETQPGLFDIPAGKIGVVVDIYEDPDGYEIEWLDSWIDSPPRGTTTVPARGVRVWRPGGEGRLTAKRVRQIG